MEQQYILPLSTLNGVLEYLASRPYSEVYQLIPKIQQAQELKENAVDGAHT